MMFGGRFGPGYEGLWFTMQRRGLLRAREFTSQSQARPIVEGVTSPQITVVAWPYQRAAHRNPILRLLYDEMQRVTSTHVVDLSPRAILAAQPPQILHVHWPDGFLAAGRGLKFWVRYVVLRVLFFVARLRGIKLVWTAHNVKRMGQPNADQLDRYFWRWFLRRTDAIVYMNEASRQATIDIVPEVGRRPAALIPLGHYLDIMSEQPSRPAPSGPPALITFGPIAAYKDTGSLVQAFLEVRPGELRLEIIGTVSTVSPDTRFEQLIGGIDEERSCWLTHRAAFLPQDDLIAAIRSADGAVFSYSDSLNSSAAIFALSAGVPILTSDLPVFRELQAIVGSDWVQIYPGHLSSEQSCCVRPERQNDFVRAASYPTSVLSTGTASPGRRFACTRRSSTQQWFRESLASARTDR